MAIWQFSLFPIPNESLRRRFEIVPTRLSTDDAEDTQWWLGHQPRKGFEGGIVRILGESPSWSNSMRIWGEERSNSILIGYLTEEKIEVEWIEVRIDLSSFSKEFVRRVCEWASELGCVAWTKSHEVVRLDYDEVLEMIKKSGAMKFMLDPEGTLKSLKPEEFERNT